MSTATRAATRRSRDPDPRGPRAARREPQGRTARERSDWARSVRAEVPRTTLGAWAPAADRPDPVALLLSQSAVRVPDLVPIRHGRMLVSPFTFYRGAALVMAADLARIPSSGIYVQACGDAHISNFGAFATPQRTMAFDINDFDETHPAPFEWDVARLAASIVIAADDLGFERAVGQGIARHSARRYREQIGMLSSLSTLDIWYSSVDFVGRVDQYLKEHTKAERKQAGKTLKKGRRKTNVGTLARLAERVDGRWHIKEDPPLIVRANLTAQQKKRLRRSFERYLDSLPKDLLPMLQQFELADFARKVVGVGSVGTEAHIALLVGRHDDDALFLQMKEATDSVLARYTVSDRFEHQGERVVIGQRLMQATSDILLGWVSSPVRAREHVDFYVRQLADYKTSFDISRMTERRIGLFADACAEALARAHARSGSPGAIAGYLGKSEAFDRAMGAFAVACADQNQLDYQAFAVAATEGRMEVRRDA